MTRGASPLGEAEFAAAFEDLAVNSGRVLLAVSGGPDSTALMQAAARWCRRQASSRLSVATVDHGLRPGSRAEADHVAVAAVALDLDHRVLPWIGRRAGPVSQDAARRARYRLLHEHAHEIGAGALVTAHTLDDQAETVLMRMAAGSGPAGLAGMRAASRRDGLLHLRPFLGFAKHDLVATCRAEGWAFVDDPSNGDTRFARVRWRRLMPALAEEGLDAPGLARLAARLRRHDDALNSVAQEALRRCLTVHDPETSSLDVKALVAEPDEIAIRVLGLAVAGDTGDARLRLERLERCAVALRRAGAEGRALRLTLGGRLLSLGRDGMLAISPERPRQRGKMRPVTLQAAEAPHSLGIDAGHA